jgi:hypothetical protein
MSYYIRTSNRTSFYCDEQESFTKETYLNGTILAVILYRS